MKTPIVTHIRGTATPLRGADIDTDRIIPARYLKVTRFDTLGEFAFYDERFDADGNTRPHPLNAPVYRGSTILIVQSNFGSGSSREHAPQALMRHGFRAFIGESFAEIFHGNCTAMGLPNITLPAADITALLAAVEHNPQLPIAIDIAEQKVIVDDTPYQGSMSEGARRAFLSGTWDSTASLVQNLTDIKKTAAAIPYLNNFAPK